MRQDHTGAGRRLLEACWIAAATALWLWLALRIGTAIAAPGGATVGGLGTLALGGVAGVLVADALSGLVHFTCDRFFTERTPLIGRTFIAPFREHHRDPEGIARHGLCERSGNNCVALLPVLVVLHSCFTADPNSYGWLFRQGFALAVCSALGLTNEVHALAHRSDVSPAIQLLQRARLILSPDAHRVHHGPGHDRSYCIATGWLNPLLDRAHVFHELERRVHQLVRASKRLAGF